MTRKKRRQGERPPKKARICSCPVCSADLQAKRCDRCHTRLIRLQKSDDVVVCTKGTLHTICRQGTVLESLELSLCDGSTISVHLEAAKILHPLVQNRFKALARGTSAVVLGRPQLGFEEHLEGLREAPIERHLIEATVVTTGPECDDLMTKAIEALRSGAQPQQRDLLPPNDEHQHDAYEEKLIELSPGRRQFVITRRGKSSFERWEHSPKLLVPTFFAIVLVNFASITGWRGVLILLGLLIPSLYLCLIDYDRIVIRIDQESVSKTFEPLPWPMSWQIERDAIVALDSDDSPLNSNSSFSSYWLWFETRTGRRRQLLSAAHFREYEYLRGAIERGLALTA